jgi:hypothetical protein
VQAARNDPHPRNPPPGNSTGRPTVTFTSQGRSPVAVSDSAFRQVVARQSYGNSITVHHLEATASESPSQSCTPLLAPLSCSENISALNLSTTVPETSIPVCFSSSLGMGTTMGLALCLMFVKSLRIDFAFTSEYAWPAPLLGAFRSKQQR